MTPSTLHFTQETLPRVEENLAFDEALLDQAEDEGLAPILRVWESGTTAVVLGASSRLLEDVRLDACRQDRVPVARRSSGGGTVVIGPGVLCVAVVLPIHAHPDLAAVDTAQRHVLSQAASALQTPQTPVRLRGHGDLTLHDRKIAGSAQRRLRHHVLVHFTVLCRFPLDRIGLYLNTPMRQPDYRQGRTHDDFLALYPATTDIVSNRIVIAFAAGRSLAPIPTPDPRIRALLADKMDREGWVDRF